MPGTRISLDNPAFAGRLRTAHSRRSMYERRAVMSSHRLISDFGRRSEPARAKTQPSAPAKLAAHRSLPNSARRRPVRSRVLMRQLVSLQTGKAKRGFNIRGLALASLAAILFVFGVGVGVTQLTTNQKVKAQVQTLAAHSDAAVDGAATSDVPSEQRPAGTSGYKVSPLAPRVLKIPKLGVDARILTLGVKSNNELQTPSNIYDAGWYRGSAQPGDANGTVLLDGHVHGPTIPGVFAGLKKLKAGDEISILRGDGKVFTYSVVKSQSYDKDNVDMGAAFNSAVPGKPGLNLITCDGTYDKDGHYANRLVVFAVQQ